MEKLSGQNKELCLYRCHAYGPQIGDLIWPGSIQTALMELSRMRRHSAPRIARILGRGADGVIGDLHRLRRRRRRSSSRRGSGRRDRAWLLQAKGSDAVGAADRQHGLEVWFPVGLPGTGGRGHRTRDPSQLGIRSRLPLLVASVVRTWESRRAGETTTGTRTSGHRSPDVPGLSHHQHEHRERGHEREPDPMSEVFRHAGMATLRRGWQPDRVTDCVARGGRLH